MNPSLNVSQNRLTHNIDTNKNNGQFQINGTHKSVFNRNEFHIESYIYISDNNNPMGNLYPQYRNKNPHI